MRARQAGSRGSRRARGSKRPRSSRRSYNSRKVALWLALCFPAGLVFLWSDRCEWNRLVKTTISAVIATAIVCIILPFTQPPDRVVGGVEIVTVDDDQIGPAPTEGFERIDLYSYNIVTESVLAAPEVTPEPVYVYCNEGGKYYHSEDCEYSKRKTSRRYPLLQALNAGYKRCPDCNAPEEY